MSELIQRIRAGVDYHVDQAAEWTKRVAVSALDVALKLAPNLPKPAQRMIATAALWVSSIITTLDEAGEALPARVEPAEIEGDVPGLPVRLFSQEEIDLAVNFALLTMSYASPDPDKNAPETEILPIPNLKMVDLFTYASEPQPEWKIQPTYLVYPDDPLPYCALPTIPFRREWFDKPVDIRTSIADKLYSLTARDLLKPVDYVEIDTNLLYDRCVVLSEPLDRNVVDLLQLDLGTEFLLRDSFIMDGNELYCRIWTVLPDGIGLEILAPVAPLEE
ncbi:hypothetical protein KKD62_01740 [Patescibacteria group bacterium]|nr:hypothetical protein [Patescibacteria group bacterium]MBU1931072.1 hypothetical protein [Patescibacteria group bacterium]